MLGFRRYELIILAVCAAALLFMAGSQFGRRQQKPVEIIVIPR